MLVFKYYRINKTFCKGKKNLSKNLHFWPPSKIKNWGIFALTPFKGRLLPREGVFLALRNCHFCLAKYNIWGCEI